MESEKTADFVDSLRGRMNRPLFQNEI